MQIVIDIDEKIYQEAKKSGYSHLYDEEVANAVANGTPLPKGHGRLIDEKDLSLMTVHMIDGIFVCDAPTIIEAESEVKNEFK